MKRKPSGYWTYERCKEAAFKTKTRFEFSRKFSRGHTVSLKNNWLNEFFPVLQNK